MRLPSRHLRAGLLSAVPAGLVPGWVRALANAVDPTQPRAKSQEPRAKSQEPRAKSQKASADRWSRRSAFAEDRCPEAHAGRTLLDGDLEVVRHADGEY